MPTTVLIGAQWGDEGKGKVSCYLARNSAVVARYSGGNNAGHTVVVNGKTFKLHLVPSGVFYPEKICVLGSGMVIDPDGLASEIRELKSAGYPCGNIKVSSLAHLVLPYHREIDALQEAARGQKAIGTTKKGIGPAYADKAERIGIRVGDIFEEAAFCDRVEFNLKIKKSRYPGLDGLLNEPDIMKVRREYADLFAPMIADTSKLIMDALARGKEVLCEGAQGTMLDLDFGTYPYVTSSATTAGGVATGLGIPPKFVDRVFGIVKAYTTRVGEGAFPSEETGEMGVLLREKGYEFGTTTGRPRRCGWLDGLVLKYGNRINGYTGWIVTKLDVLTGLPEIKFCEAYGCGSDNLREFPVDSRAFNRSAPVYRAFPGWNEDITRARKISDLPKNCRTYLSFIEEYTGVPISLISIGADRDSMIAP